MRTARKIAGASILSLLMACPALADLPGCERGDIPAPALKGVQKAARREAAGPLDLQTLFYCTTEESARAAVDTIPVPRSDDSEDVSTLLCSGSSGHSRDWTCHVERYLTIRVAPLAGQPQVRVAVGERSSAQATREYALKAFALLNAPGHVAACPGTAAVGHTNESLRAILARRYGPYTLVISREGFALMRAGIQVRIRSANAFNPRDQLQCWEEQPVDE